jgi:hypothetical protein
MSDRYSCPEEEQEAWEAQRAEDEAREAEYSAGLAAQAEEEARMAAELDLLEEEQTEVAFEKGINGYD